MAEINKIYLGDSVYAQYDQYGQIILTTENAITCVPSNRIMLDQKVLENFIQYLKKIGVKT